MREYTIRHSSLGESPGRNVNQRASQRLRKSGFWLNGKLRIGLLAVAATAALFIAGCGSSETEEVLVVPQAAAPAEPGAPTTPGTEADPVTDPVSDSEADIGDARSCGPDAPPGCVVEPDIGYAGFSPSETCWQEGEVPDSGLGNLIAVAARLNEAFPNFSAESTGGGASPAQTAAFILTGCEVSVEELREMAQDGQIGVETTRLIQAVTSENLADFPNAYYESQCVRVGAATEDHDHVLKAPHRILRVVMALTDTWLAIHQPGSGEFQQEMTPIAQRLAGDIWDALVDEGGAGDFALREQSEAEAEQIRQSIQQTCGYELVRINRDA